MAHAKSFFYYSLLATLALMSSDAYSAIRVGNKSRSYANAYNQVNEIRNPSPAPTMASAHTDDLGVAGQTENSPSTVELPIHVANQTLASEIASGDASSVTLGKLQNCGSVYPNGEFAWDNPTVGSRAGTGSQCVAVVEMRGYQMGPNGSDAILARVNVAAGDTVKCNISAWPEGSYLAAAGTIEFPADAEPTTEDVIAVMNQEQKQHAGLKIAAGTLVAAVAGNALGANEVGKDSLLGTNKEKLQSTAIGGLTGAAIMAGNVYGGKVAGDMILSAGVNAAAGGLIGNMAATGDEVLKIEDCGTYGKCLWAEYIKTTPLDTENNTYYFDIAEEEAWVCPNKTSKNESTSTTQEKNTSKDCVPIELVSITPVGYENARYEKGSDREGFPYTIATMANEKYAKINTSYRMNESQKQIEQATGAPNPSGDNKFVKIASAGIPKATTHIVMVGVQDKAFGWRKKDWNEFTKQHPNAKIMGRGLDGKPYDLTDDIATELASADAKDNIHPVYQGADDGALIDLGNKARLKGTLIGAGAGGALGAFAAYQGAQTEIQERWVTAVREYKDSLQKIFCATGSRFLSQYNDVVTIPLAAE